MPSGGPAWSGSASVSTNRSGTGAGKRRRSPFRRGGPRACGETPRRSQAITSHNGPLPAACARMASAASGAGTNAPLPPTGDARMVLHLSRDMAASDPAPRGPDGSTADPAPPNVGLRLEDRPRCPSSTAARRRSMADAAGILDDVRRRMGRDPEGARAAALRLVALLTPPAGGKPMPVRGGLAPWQRRKVDRHIQESLEGTLRVKDLAEQVSLSVSHFCRAFKESFGASPHLHLIRLRVERAQHLMLTTDDPLTHIALACGMADQAHLSKVFRREVGEPPNTWRRRSRTGVEAQKRGGPRIDRQFRAGPCPPSSLHPSTVRDAADVSLPSAPGFSGPSTDIRKKSTSSGRQRRASG